MKLQIPEAFGFLFTPSRYKVSYGGRGGAKSESYGRALLAQGMSEPMGVLCGREIQKSIKDSVHRMLRDIVINDPFFNNFYEVFETEIKGKNGTFFIFMGLKHNIQEIKSLKGIKRCWVEEAQGVSDKSWETLIPTIREPDSEIWVSFNPKNPTDPTWQRFVLEKDEDMIVREVGWQDNPYFPAVLEKERLKLKKKDPEAYAHVWEGKFDTRYSGSVYAKYVKPDQIKDIEYDPARAIYTSWDLGFDDATAIIFYQVALNEITVIDYYEANFQDIQHYCEVLYGREIIVKERDPRTGKIIRWDFGEILEGSEHRDEYNYTGSTHYVPHDAANKLQAAGGRSIVEQAAELGVKLHVIGSASQQDNEQALRKTLTNVWFKQSTTKDLVQALMNYHYEFDEERKIYAKVPVHDWSSHGCDAMELMARMWKNSGLTMTQIKAAQQSNQFRHLRTKHNIDNNADPYRLKPLAKKQRR